MFFKIPTCMFVRVYACSPFRQWNYSYIISIDTLKHCNNFAVWGTMGNLNFHVLFFFVFFSPPHYFLGVIIYRERQVWYQLWSYHAESRLSHSLQTPNHSNKISDEVTIVKLHQIYSYAQISQWFWKRWFFLFLFASIFLWIQPTKTLLIEPRGILYIGIG